MKTLEIQELHLFSNIVFLGLQKKMFIITFLKTGFCESVF